MLDGAMREAREAAVELVGADAGAMELLLRHLYGGTIEVPVSMALQLFALADQYQVAEGLRQRLRLWLPALRLAPDVLCDLGPAVRTVCPGAWNSFVWQTAEDLEEVSSLPAFAGWPVEAVADMLAEADSLPGFHAAVSWMEAHPQPAERQQGNWQRLWGALRWDEATRSKLSALQEYANTGSTPGLQELLEGALEDMYERLVAGAQGAAS
jgi:hypothetical protein